MSYTRTGQKGPCEICGKEAEHLGDWNEQRRN